MIYSPLSSALLWNQQFTTKEISQIKRQMLQRGNQKSWGRGCIWNLAAILAVLLLIFTCTGYKCPWHPDVHLRVSPSHTSAKPDSDVSCTYICFCSQFTSGSDAASCRLWWGLDEQQGALLVTRNDLSHSHWAVWGCCPSMVLHPGHRAGSLQTLGVIPPLTAIYLGRNPFCSHLPTHLPRQTHLLLRYWLSNFHSSFQSGHLLYFFKICFLHTPSIWDLNIHVFSVFVFDLEEAILLLYNAHSWIRQ